MDTTTNVDPAAITPQDTSTPAWMVRPTIEVPQQSTNTPQNVDPREIKKIREKAPVFRILLIGKANSGKTTLIKKMCDTNEEPIIYVIEGGERKKLDASVLNPSAMRGEHDINAEVTFESHPNFVFHDSRGFEAGSVDEVEKVRAFIEERSKKTKLSERLHVIWFCIPVDGTRVASPAELSFFNQSSGDVPVVLIFTKWDGQIIRCCGTLCDEQGMTMDEAMEAAPEHAKRILEDHFVPVFKNTTHPPSSYTVLGYMDEPETKCDELVEKTAAALNDNVLKKLFVSVQTHNLGISMEYGIREALDEEIFCWSSSWIVNHESAIAWVLSWFSHIYWNHDYSERLRLRRRDFRQLFNHVIATSRHVFYSPLLRGLSNVACTAITCARSFELKKRMGGDDRAALKASIEEYLASPQYNAVNTAIKSKFGQHVFKPYVSKATAHQIQKELYDICLENLLTD